MKNLIKVVIIDDNESLTFAISDNINNLDEFEVVGIALDGESGIALVKELKPNVVILDIVMPKKDGLGVLEYFRDKRDEFKETEFVILSAIEHDLITKYAINIGAMYYLIKPFEMKDLMSRLQQLFVGSKQFENTLHELDSPKQIDNHVHNELVSLGIPMHIKGYQYIDEAVKLCLKRSGESIKITKYIYPVLAEKYGTSPGSVERAIRTAVEITLLRGNKQYLKVLFKNMMFNNKITNKEFILGITKSVETKM